jgi:flagellar motor switch/type III secretory pathway protein FliN
VKGAVRARAPVFDSGPSIAFDLVQPLHASSSPLTNASVSGNVIDGRKGPERLEGSRRMSTAAQMSDAKAAETALPAPAIVEPDGLDSIPWLPCTISVELPVVRFTIGDLLRLGKGSIVETSCHQSSDVPLRVNRLLIGWTEFDVINDRIAVRITEQA